MNKNRKLSNCPLKRYSNSFLHGKSVKFASQSSNQMPSAFPSSLSGPRPASGMCVFLDSPPLGWGGKFGVNTVGKREQLGEETGPQSLC